MSFIIMGYRTNDYSAPSEAKEDGALYEFGWRDELCETWISDIIGAVDEAAKCLGGSNIQLYIADLNEKDTVLAYVFDSTAQCVMEANLKAGLKND